MRPHNTAGILPSTRSGATTCSKRSCGSALFSLPEQEETAASEYCTREGIAYVAYLPEGGWGKAKRALPRRVALAWLRPGRRPVIPIPGSSRPESVHDSAVTASEGRRLQNSNVSRKPVRLDRLTEQGELTRPDSMLIPEPRETRYGSRIPFIVSRQ